MTSIEHLQLLLDGRRGPGHFMMPLVKQFCTIQCGQPYGRYSQDHRVLTACQLEIARRFPVDIFNVLGHPYREAADCGLPVEFPADAQPVCRGVLLRDRADLARLRWPDPAQGRLMSDRITAIRRFRELRPDMVAMGACEAPFAQANTFLGLERTMLALYDEPDLVRAVMDWIEPHERRFALAQIEAGAAMMFVGDALASQVGHDLYVEHVLPTEKRLIESIQATGVPVRFHICGDIGGILDHVAGTGARFIDIDYKVDLARACEAVAAHGPGAWVVGNLDPVGVLLAGTPDQVRAACRSCERQAAGFANFILAPGCEVPPATPPANYQAMLEFGWKARAGAA